MLLSIRNCSSDLPCVEELISPILAATSSVAAKSAMSAMNLSIWEIRTSELFESELLKLILQPSVSCNHVVPFSFSGLCSGLQLQLLKVSRSFDGMNADFRITDELASKIRSLANNCWFGCALIALGDQVD